MRQAVAYMRVSTNGQTGEDSFGLDAQKEQIIEYCKANDIHIVD
jgi:DNA invertase Pin-like site-specific DNA recombinase